MVSNRTKEIQVLYEFAMCIGEDHDLRIMLKNSLSVFFRKLKCSAVGVHLLSDVSSRVFAIEQIFTIPRSINRNTAYQSALEKIPSSVTSEKLGIFRQNLPISGQTSSGKYYHILDLPGQGFLIITKSGVELEPLLIKSLKHPCLKLSNAIEACQQREKLRESEKRLEKSELFFKTVFNNITDSLHIIDKDFHIVMTNKKLLDLKRLKQEEIVGKHCYEIYQNRNCKCENCAAQEVVKTGKPYTINNELPLKDSSSHFYEINGFPIFDSAGKISHVIEITHDITEHQLADEALKKQTKQLEILNQVITAVNNATEQQSLMEIILELTLELMSFDCGGIYIVNENERTAEIQCSKGISLDLLEVIKRVKIDEKPYSTIFIKGKPIITNHYESVAPVHAKISGIKSLASIPFVSKDRVVGAINVASNSRHAFPSEEIEILLSIGREAGTSITKMLAESDHKRLESQFMQAQKMESVGRLAGGVAHDFNNMLTVVIGNAELALMSISTDDPVYKDIEEIKNIAGRASNLTRQLLAFSRKQIIEPEILNINNLLLEIDKMLRRLIGEDIDFAILPFESLWDIKVDPGQVEQVLTNLVVNSRDAMPMGGKLTIETANITLDEEYAQHHNGVVPGDYVMIAVSDTGVGMDEETKTKIFEPFFTTKEKHRGTGLGLSTCYGIIKQNGGNIWVYSEPGHGTTIKIYLPRVVGESISSPVKNKQSGLLIGTETVLVVEDEKSVRKMTKRILLENGYFVLEAANGEEALHLVENHDSEKIHLLITDVIMPLMGGKELSEKLQKRYPPLKVLFISGYTDNSIVHHGVLDPGISFIQKPFNTEALLRKVRDVLDE